jgi:hypothetical protein
VNDVYATGEFVTFQSRDYLAGSEHGVDKAFRKLQSELKKAKNFPCIGNI